MRPESSQGTVDPRLQEEYAEQDIGFAIYTISYSTADGEAANVSASITAMLCIGCKEIAFVTTVGVDDRGTACRSAHVT